MNSFQSQKIARQFPVGAEVVARVDGGRVRGEIAGTYQHDFNRQDQVFVVLETDRFGKITVTPSRVLEEKGASRLLCFYSTKARSIAK
jgi:hypothetical protein